MPRTPKISYKHALSEIAVNRDDPLEIVRELISNAYDAKATLIRIFPLVGDRTLVFFDNGIGLDDTKEIGDKSVTAFQAFFSIGTSTKERGTAIGYKCQGSKLCFATSRTIVITRCKAESSWRCIVIENPRMNLSDEFPLNVVTLGNPWEFLHEKLFSVQSTDTPKLKAELNENFFEKVFKTGTLIAMVELDAENFGDNFGISQNYPKLIEYIKFYTAHGDTRKITRPELGFPKSCYDSFRKLLPEKPVTLKIWGYGSDIPFGFPYLEKPENLDIKTPLDLARLSDGSFFTRHAATINHEEKPYCLILAVDGNRRALSEYYALNRKGGSRSGIQFSEQRGVILSAHGVRVSDGTFIFNHPTLQDFKVLSDTGGRSHYQLVINGEWDLVTNRNEPSSASKKVLNDAQFLEKIRKFLVNFAENNDTFSQLLKRLKRDNSDNEIEQQAKRIEALKDGLKYREKFTVKDIEVLKGRTFVAPQAGEEYLVAVLYSMFSILVATNHKFARFWKRPLTLSSVGIDSLVVENESKPFDVSNKMLEFKCFFDPTTEFNHPLKLTHTIVTWSFAKEPKIGQQIKDEFGFLATFAKLPDVPPDVGFLLKNVSNEESGETLPHTISILCLRSLLENSFNLEYMPGVSPVSVKSKGKS